MEGGRQAGSCHVSEAGVGDVATKGDVKLCQSLMLFGQESDANVTDVITRTEVDLLQGGDFGQRLEASVGNADAKTQVDALQIPQALRDVTQTLVTEFLTILKAEAF